MTGLQTFFRTFSLIFTISLKLVGPNEPIENMIIEQSPPLVNANVRPALIKALLKNNDKVLLILDGYDEMSENARESLYLKQLLHSELYGNLCLVMTSRPQMTTDIERHFSSVASIEGFSKEAAEQFVGKFFPNYPDTVKAIIAFTGRSGIRDMWRIPILLLFTCVLVDGKLLDISPSANVAFNKIYDKLIECVFRRHLAKMGKVIDKKKLDILIQDMVIKFGQIALECLGDDSNLCKSSDIKSLIGPDAFEYGLIIGAVDRTMVLCDHDDVKVSFLHRSLQEYLAAHFVLNKIRTENCHLKDLLSDKVQQDPLGKYMLFSSFLNEMMSNKISLNSMQTEEQNASTEVAADNDSPPKRKSARVSTPDPEHNLKPNQNEMVMNGQKVLLEIAQESLSKKEDMVVTGYAVTPASSQFVMDVLKSNTSLIRLSFDNLDLSHCLTQLFASQLPSVRYIRFGNCTFQEDQEVANALGFSTYPFPLLKGFSLDACIGITHHVADMLGNLLRQCDQLRAIGIYRCNLQNALMPLLKGTYHKLDTLCFYNCDIQESLKISNQVHISMEKMQWFTLHQCTIDAGAYRHLAKCMSTSKGGITLDVQCKDAADLDSALFAGQYRSVGKIRFSNAKDEDHHRTPQLGDLETFLTGAELSANVFHGSLPIVSEITFDNMVLKPNVMQSLAISLQHCQVPLSLIFRGCDLIDGMIFLGQKGLPKMQRLVFNHSNLIDRPTGKERIQIGGFASLPALLVETNSQRALHLAQRMYDYLEKYPSRAPEAWKVYDHDYEHDIYMAPDDVYGHLSSQSICILCKCISQSSKLSVLKIPMTGEAVQILVDNDLPLVVVMEFYVRKSDHGQKQFGSNVTQGNDNLTSLKRFQNLRILHVFTDADPGSTRGWKGKRPPKTKVPLQHEGWRQFFSSLAGNRSLSKCNFDSMDTTGCLALFLSETLQSLEYLYFSYCKLQENVTDLSTYTGNLPNLSKFEIFIKEDKHELSKCILENSALRLLCTCLVESNVLEEFRTGDHPYYHGREFFSGDSSEFYTLDEEGTNYRMTDSYNYFDEAPQINFKSCLSTLLQMPLPRLREVDIDSCTLKEEFYDNMVLSSQEALLPSLETARFSGRDSCLPTGETHNSGMKFLCKVLAGSPYLRSVSFKDIDCTGCLAFLLSKEYPRLTHFSLEGCMLGEEKYVQPTDFCGVMPRVSEIDLSTCKYVSNSAAKILCASLSGGNLTSLKL